MKIRRFLLVKKLVKKHWFSNFTMSKIFLVLWKRCFLIFVFFAARERPPHYQPPRRAISRPAALSAAPPPYQPWTSGCIIFSRITNNYILPHKQIHNTLLRLFLRVPISFWSEWCRICIALTKAKCDIYNNCFPVQPGTTIQSWQHRFPSAQRS